MLKMLNLPLSFIFVALHPQTPVHFLFKRWHAVTKTAMFCINDTFFCDILVIHTEKDMWSNASHTTSEIGSNATV